MLAEPKRSAQDGVPQAPDDGPGWGPGSAACHGNLFEAAIYNGESFERLIEQARRAHGIEVEHLRHELRSLRGVLAAADLDDGSGAAATAVRPQQRTKTPPLKSEVIFSPMPRMPSKNGPEQKEEAQAKLAPSLSMVSKMANNGSRSRRKPKGFGSVSSKKSEVEEEDHHTFLWRVVRHPAFEVATGLLITINGLCMAAEAQYLGSVLAAQVGHTSSGGASSDSMSKRPAVFEVLNMTFGVIFVLELLVRIAGLRLEFVREVWNLVDLALVTMWLVGESTSALIDARIVRLARLSRLLRLLRLVRHMRSQHAYFDSLHLIATALKGSTAVLFWAFTFIMLMHMLLGVAVNQILRELYFEQLDPAKIADPGSDEALVFEYYGSFSRSFLTMFEITLANWPVPCRILVEKVHESWIIYSVVHKMTLGFAIVGIINGVFIQETFKVAASDDQVMVKQAAHKQRVHREKMFKLFVEADENRDGQVDLEEWKKVCEDEWVRVWLASQDVVAEDAAALFERLDNGDGLLTADEIIDGVARLKGPASSMQMLDMVSQIGNFQSQVMDELLVQQAVASERAGGCF